MKTNPEFVSFLIHLSEEERGVDIEVLGNLLGVDLEQSALDASVLHKGLCRWTKDGVYVDRDYIHLVLAEVDEVRPKVQKHFEAYNDLFRVL